MRMAQYRSDEYSTITADWSQREEFWLTVGFGRTDKSFISVPVLSVKNTGLAKNLILLLKLIIRASTWHNSCHLMIALDLYLLTVYRDRNHTESIDA